MTYECISFCFIFSCKDGSEYTANIQRKYFGGETSGHRNGKSVDGKMWENQEKRNKHVSRYMF